ncbi:MAG: class I SAM-dependent methyltransferase [Firmicutes bacterium]|nr:class I SAM-dependent methyltransferase [Bacillota bacterium]
MTCMLNFDGKKYLPGKSFQWRGNAGDFAFGLDEQQIRFFKEIINKHAIQKVLDVFCGNGELAVLLAQWDKDVTVFVPEPLLIKEINSKSIQAGVKLGICLGDMRDISALYREQCGLIVCLQNSLSCLLSKEDICGTLAQMYLKLKPGGVLVMHTLNYDYLLKRDHCPVSVLERQHAGLKIKLWLKPGKEREKAKLIFDVVPADGKNGAHPGPGEEIIVPVRPLFKKELDLWLTELGYKKIKSYGWFDCKTALNNSCHRITVASRPG